MLEQELVLAHERAREALVQLEEERARSVVAAREVMNAAAAAAADREKALRILSHELRTPIQSVVGGLGLLERRVHDRSAKELVLRMMRAGDTLTRLLGDIGALSKGSALLFRPKEEAYSVTEMVNDVCSNHLARAVASDLAIVWRGVDGPDMVLGDPKLTGQVLDNLVSNAVKYTRAGSVTVSAEVEVGPKEDARLNLRVHDTGPGIALADQSRIFEPFVRLDAALEDGVEGTGVGLAVVRQIVNVLHGDVQLTSEPGRGATFAVSLPVRLVTGGATREGIAAENRPGGQPPRLLLVEDEPDVRDTVAAMLAELGYLCDCASNGREAWRLISDRPQRYRLVITDLEMPEKGGEQLAAEVRALGRPGLPILALTAYPEHMNKHADLFEAYLQKPVTLDQLRHAIEQQLAPAAN